MIEISARGTGKTTRLIQHAELMSYPKVIVTPGKGRQKKSSDKNKSTYNFKYRFRFIR